MCFASCIALAGGGAEGKYVHGGKYTRRQCLTYTYFRLPCVCKLLPLHLLYMFEGRVDEGEGSSVMEIKEKGGIVLFFIILSLRRV